MTQYDTKEWSLPSAYHTEVAGTRFPDRPINPLILNRWSPRAYSHQSVPEEALFTVLEAARWAPSSSNQQPWRFYVARTAAEHEVFRSFIKPNNRLWTDGAPVLLLIASDSRKDNGEPNGSHAFDAGAAWGILSLQAQLLGLSTRAVGGYDRFIARKVLNTPDYIELHAVIVLGYRGDTAKIPESLWEREKPSIRKPAADFLLTIPIR